MNSVPSSSSPFCLAIVGPSGSGKDTIANWLADHENCTPVVSFTTRPMRDGEQQGREHHFVDECPGVEHFVCHTNYGGYDYWTTTEQFLTHRTTVYVVDEVGLIQLLQMQEQGTIRIFSIYVECDEEIRLKRGVTPERIERDRNRQALPKEMYNVIIKNNKSKKALEHKLKQISNDLRL